MIQHKTERQSSAIIYCIPQSHVKLKRREWRCPAGTTSFCPFPAFLSDIKALIFLNVIFFETSKLHRLKPSSASFSEENPRAIEEGTASFKHNRDPRMMVPLSSSQERQPAVSQFCQTAPLREGKGNYFFLSPNLL